MSFAATTVTTSHTSTTTPTTATTTSTSISPIHERPTGLRRPLASSVSTPNLAAAFTASAPASSSLQSYSQQPSFSSSRSRLLPPSLSHKGSYAALTPSSLASIPDVSESYALDSVLRDPSQNMPPMTPARPSADGLAIGDTVDVPGGMQGTVKFVGQVQGKKGTFAGVELHSDYASRGKNNGDVDGVSYFNTSVSGAGIFLPVNKAIPRTGTPSSVGSFHPLTPTASTYGGLRAGNNSIGFTPPTPNLKFSASVGPGARPPSPYGKQRSVSGLHRPESPMRRLQTPGAKQQFATPARPPSARGSSPTSRFSQSVRGTAGDPLKKPPRLPSLTPRSVSAMGSVSGQEDDDAVSIGIQRTKTNGSVGSVSSLNLRVRPPSRLNGANGANGVYDTNGANGTNDISGANEEVERLKAQLEDRERQLKEQANALGDMESSLVELQGLMEHADATPQRRDSIDDKDSSQLRRILREKNEKIAMLTAEFDAHRADFRSTIDTLELASNETERVYEKKIEELMIDIRELESRNLDVDSVAIQLKQLEELVQELEEGLEDARRGEAEARGEVEFLRGEVERTRTELEREREKVAALGGGGTTTNGDSAVSSKELEQKEDEIRGLKAIIHSLSRDSVPNYEDRTPTQGPNSFIGDDAIENKLVRDNLERQVAELQSMLEKKGTREEELEKEVASLRRASAPANPAPIISQRSSHRDSRDTIIARGQGARSPETMHRRANTLDTMPESDAYSATTETSTLWCEICETNGHDILTCTNMFGPDGAKSNTNTTNNTEITKSDNNDNLKPRTPTGRDVPAPLSPFKAKPQEPDAPVKAKLNPLESGPVAGKESGIMDPEKWCAVCERDGHDSVDCPFEDDF